MGTIPELERLNKARLNIVVLYEHKMPKEKGHHFITLVGKGNKKVNDWPEVYLLLNDNVHLVLIRNMKIIQEILHQSTLN